MVKYLKAPYTSAYFIQKIIFVSILFGIGNHFDWFPDSNGVSSNQFIFQYYALAIGSLLSYVVFRKNLRDLTKSSEAIFPPGWVVGLTMAGAILLDLFIWKSVSAVSLKMPYSLQSDYDHYLSVFIFLELLSLRNFLEKRWKAKNKTSTMKISIVEPKPKFKITKENLPRRDSIDSVNDKDLSLEQIRKMIDDEMRKLNTDGPAANPSKLGMVDKFFRSIMTAGTPDSKTEAGKEEIFGKMEVVILTVLQSQASEFRETSRDDDNGLLYLNGFTTIDEVEYSIHTYYHPDSKHFYMALWDSDEMNILLMLAEGYIRETSYLTRLGKMRLKKYLNDVAAA